MGNDAAPQSLAERLTRTYLAKVVPCYSSLQKELNEEGREKMSVLLNWVRDVFSAIKNYGALEKENAELRREIQRLTQEKHELEKAVELALKVDETE